MDNSKIGWTSIITVALNLGFYVYEKESLEIEDYIMLLATLIYTTNCMFSIQRLLQLCSIKSQAFYFGIISIFGIICFFLWRLIHHLSLNSFQYFHEKDLLTIEPFKVVVVFMLMLALGTCKACGLYTDHFCAKQPDDPREIKVARSSRIFEKNYIKPKFPFKVTPSQTVLKNRRALYKKFGA